MSISYTNVNTKVRAMYGKMFKADDYEELLRQSSVKYCLMYLKGKEEYEEELKDANGDIHRGELEQILKNVLNKDINRILELIDKKDRELMRGISSKDWANEDPKIEIVGVRAEVLNILSIYRAKKYYNMDKTSTEGKLIPIRYKLSKDKLDKMCEQNDVNDFINVIGTTIYSKVFKLDSDDFEKEANEYLFEIYKRELRQGSESLSTILAYIFLREIEIKNIVNIIEGIRYSMDLGRIRSKLVV